MESINLLDSKIIIGKRYPIVGHNSRSDDKTFILQYLFKPSTITNNNNGISGQVHILNTNEVNVALEVSNLDNGNENLVTDNNIKESFKGIVEQSTNEFVLKFDENINGFVINKIDYNINSLRHTRNEEIFGKKIITNKSKTNKVINTNDRKKIKL